MNKLTKTFQYGDHEVTLETGQIARQATGSVMVSMGRLPRSRLSLLRPDVEDKVILMQASQWWDNHVGQLSG